MNKDIISFEYFEEMTTNWNRIDLLRRCYDLCNEMVEKKQEIERLNNIINEAIKYIKENTSDGYIIVDDLNYYDIPELLRILQGSDKE